MAATHKKKLIEVALPLPEINDASAYDKMPGIGPHPKGIHHWWARLPLPTARAILFASVVDDPEAHPEKWPTEEEQNAERERLFDILRRMMRKKLHEAPKVYAEAKAEMLKHCDGKLPAVFDPFAGGGSIPLEANRMGFEAHAGDLNPVAVLLNKCNLEISPRWAASPPVNPIDRKQIDSDGLAADVRYYGALVRDRALQKIGKFYPKAQLPKELGGGETNVIAWIWARTVASPNPATRGKHVPLIRTYWLSTNEGNLAWLRPVVDRTASIYRFEVNLGSPPDKSKVAAGTKAGRAGFKCIFSDDPITFEYIRNEGRKGAIGTILIAVVADLGRGKTYLSASDDHEIMAKSANPTDYPETELPEKALGFRIQNYGIRKHWMMFSRRQLQSLSALCAETVSLQSEILKDGIDSGMSVEEAELYASHVSTFLSLCIDRCVDFNNTLCRWSASNQKVMNLFGRQAIPMVFDFAEANIFGHSVGAWSTCSDYIAKCITTITACENRPGTARQIDAATGSNGIDRLLVSTDPPYYDNIGYASLSDVFYVWMRKSLSNIYPELFSTVLVPKLRELTAAPERFEGDREKAKQHFESGFRSTFAALRQNIDQSFPLTVYYAFKQDVEEGGVDTNNVGGVDLTTGWETLLDALISSGFQITGTWPVRASQKWRMVSMGTNALASYIVLACRTRSDNAPQIASNQFRNELKRSLPAALLHLQQGNIAPVDFAQAAIGPGMAVYSQYSRILDSSGKTMTVRAALGIINQTLTEVLSELEDDFDANTRWAISWFEQYGFSEGNYGNAELLSKAKVTSVGRLQQAGIVQSGGGKVTLLAPPQLPLDWDPASKKHLTVWEITHHLLRVYHFEKAGDEAAAALLREIGNPGEVARELAYRLHNISERKKWSQEAQGYNALVLGWPEIARLAREIPAVPKAPVQSTLI